MKRLIILCVFVIGQSVFSFAYASNCEPSSQACVKTGKFEIALAVGVGQRSNPLIQSDDIPLLLIPKVSYYGERFFLDTTTVGYSLFESPSHTLNTVATLSFDQIYFDRWNIGNFQLEGGLGNTSGSPATGGDITDPPLDNETNDDPLDRDSPENIPALVLDDLASRGMALLAGGEYIFYADRWNVNFQALTDISSVHSGEELRVAFTLPLAAKKHHVDLAFGGVWQDANIINYYYGISSEEAPHEVYQYRTESAFTPFVRVDWKYRLNNKWHLQFSSHIKWFGEQISNSPIVDASQSSTLFFGGVYHF